MGRYGIVLILILLGPLSVAFALISGSKSPEKTIIGKWQEVSWHYEKVNESDSSSIMSEKLISEYVKRQLGQDLIIHEAETWEFTKDRTLKLSSELHQLKTVDWRMKGRGHILELEYPDHAIEHYDLSVQGNEMTLQFDIDMQVRGIVKLTFRRIQ